MATQSITFSQRIESDARSLFVNAGFLRDCPRYCRLSIIDIKKEGAYAIALLDLSQQVEDVQKRTQITSNLQKAQKKLAQAEQIYQFIQKGDPNAVHPRVEQLIARLTRMKEPPENPASVCAYPVNPASVTAFFGKLDKSRLQLSALSDLKQASLEAREKAQSMAHELDMRALQKYSEVVYFHEPWTPGPHTVLDKRYCSCYADCSAPEEAQKMASALWAAHYLDFVTQFTNMRLKNFARVGPELHLSMAVYLKEQSSVPLSIPNLNLKIYESKLSPISFTEAMLAAHPELKKGPLAFPAEPNAKQIIEKLGTLIELKNAHQLKSMGAFIGIGPQMVAIVFHSPGRISLYDPCGNQRGPGGKLTSYEANFGTIKQAAHFLMNLTDQIGPKEPVTLQPYCSNESLKAGWISASISIHSLQPMQGTPMMPGVPMMTNMMPGAILPSSSAFSTSQGNFQLLPGQMAFPEADSESEASEVSEDEDEDEPEVKLTSCSVSNTFDMQRVIEQLSLSTVKGFNPASITLDGLPLEGPPKNRLYFHLSQIQNNEIFDVVGNACIWGKKAFHTKELATPEQRLRAAQRTQVEMLLEELQKRTEGGSVDALVQLLEQLEGLKLHTDDLPKGQTNAALALFDKCVQIHEKLRIENPRMDDPRDQKFQGEFGRRFFRGDFSTGLAGGKIRVQALEDLLKDFKTAWGI